MNNKMKTLVFSCLLMILAAQFSVNLFFADFEISVAVIFLPVFLFLKKDFPILPAALCSGTGVFLVRLFLSWLRNGDLSVAWSFYPEILFYFCYGLLLFAGSRLLPKKDGTFRFFFPYLAAIDYLSNLAELLLREGSDAFLFQAQAAIFLVAVLRTGLIWCVLTTLDQYRLLLLRREHEKRYRNLLLLISRLHGEVLWMEKNTHLIESTMNTAYRLYEELKKQPGQESFARSALAVAGDIHEIKKEYLLIMRGISEVLDQELKSSGMYMEEILILMKDALIRLGKEKEKDVTVALHCSGRLYTTRHYAWMSVFRNLFTNALEAADTPFVRIEATQTFTEQTCVFTVTDHGPGIPLQNQEEIFHPGFSTKINYETGEISRGLGLNLVRGLITDQFHGSISLASRPGETTFTIEVPKTEFETETTEERMIP